MNGLKQFSRCLSFTLGFILLTVASCKDSFDSSIPYVRVNFTINLVNNNDLTVPGNLLVFPAGYGGVIVMNIATGYVAFDAACPYEVDPAVRVEPDASGRAVCPSCASQFNLWMGGSKEGSGPAKEPLKPYNVSQSGNMLIVTN
ncbi:hypothetical protein [Gaoshiqia sp. Z1-71]|uniref:hypothetical protein n=1 Tax=Gaoshiqia hydrogeniformans TaxID=3290090 RepID=UPI003BF8E706